MNVNSVPAHVRAPMTEAATDLHHLFHRLNNQLGIILSHAELLEAKLGDGVGRARAAQVIASALDAMSTAKEIRIKAVGTDLVGS